MKWTRFVWMIWMLAVCAAVRGQELRLEPDTAPTLESPDYRLIETPEAEAEEREATPEPPAAGAGFFLDVGIQYVDVGEYEEAERAYRRALEEDPENVELRFRLGTLYVLMERYPEGEVLLAALLEDLPEHPLVHNNLAWIYAAGTGMRDSQRALRHARTALLYAPASASVWNTLAEAYYIGGDYDRAMRSAQTAYDLLQVQGDSEHNREVFEAQKRKIRQAAELSAMLDEETDP